MLERPPSTWAAACVAGSVAGQQTIRGYCGKYIHRTHLQVIANNEEDNVLWEILIQFVFRLALGLAATMALTSPKQVDSGFFRVHLWVLLGLGTFGSLVAYSRQSMFEQPTLVLALAIGVTVLSYVGSVVWLYEKTTMGMLTLIGIVIATLALLMLAQPSKEPVSQTDWMWMLADVVAGSLILGTTFAAMLLGHWYLNSPTMQLSPLRWLLLLMVISIIARSVISVGGFAIHFTHGDINNGFAWAATAMRWLAGLLGLAGMTWMTWMTLKIPNTQSATGILYVALLFVFLGELASAILTFNTPVPL